MSGDVMLQARLCDVFDVGAIVVCQVRTVDGARRAAAADVDVVTAQGTEAGGHTGRVSTLPLVPAVVDAVAPLPVVAAGGIADGRGIAAALMLGAECGSVPGSSARASAVFPMRTRLA